MHHGTQVRRDHRHRIEHHALRAVGGVQERGHNLKSLECTGLLRTGALTYREPQLLCFGFEVEGLQPLLDGCGTHVALKPLTVAIAHLAIEPLVAFEVLHLQVAEALEYGLHEVDPLIGPLAQLLHLSFGGVLHLTFGVRLGAFRLERCDVLFQLAHTLADFVIPALL